MTDYVPIAVAAYFSLAPAAIRALYRDRWPVEQLPLAAKQMIGAHRQFVFSDENCQRLPEISAQNIECFGRWEVRS